MLRMSRVIDKTKRINENSRLHTSICLIMLIEYLTLDFEELIKMTGLSFQEIRGVLQNLSDMNLIKILPNFKSIPKVELIDENKAQILLNELSSP